MDNLKVGCALFGGCDIDCTGEKFEGAKLSAIFGGVDCNLKNAIVENDCEIKARAVFGGVDIIVPPNVNVKVSSVNIFGGTDNKTTSCEGAPTIYIKCFSMFGGVEIK